jgi:putative protein kinase ArgK-like GTPase of G3E family
VVVTQGTAPRGVDELLRQIERHRAHASRAELERRRRRRALARVRGLLEAELRRRADRALDSPGVATDAARRILEGSATPRSVAEEVLGLVLDRKHTDP